MTQQHINLGKEYLKVLKNTRKRKISTENKSRVCKQLFCDERPVSPTVVQHNNDPMSYNNLSNSEETIFFMGYKFPADKNYKCAACFERALSSGLSEVEKELCLDANLITGEISYKQFKNNLWSREDPLNVCYSCKKQLTVIRQYDSAHLDFE